MSERASTSAGVSRMGERRAKLPDRRSTVPVSPPPDPRAVRVGVAAADRLPGDEPRVVAPAAPPPDAGVAPAPSGAGDGATPGGLAGVLVDGRPVAASLRWLDGERTVLEIADAAADGAPDPATEAGRGYGPEAPSGRNGLTGTPVVLGPVHVRPADGAAVREVLIAGWRFELEIEREQRAALRERARRGHEAASHRGPLEIRAIITGRIVAVSVAPGDAVEAGQQLLILEAMKMQNELRAPRDGSVDRVAVEIGSTVEVGDLLLVLA